MAKYMPMQHTIPNEEATGYAATQGGFKEVRYGIVKQDDISSKPIPVEEKPYIPRKKEITIESILNPPKPVSLKKADLPEKKEEEKKVEENKDGYNGTIHKVEYTDTLDGVSIRYGISKELIRIENSFLGDEIYMFKFLKIPFAKKTLYEKTDKFDIEKMKKQE
jgi:hypothetical protein